MKDVLYGRHPVLEALKAGTRIEKIMIASGAKPAPILEEIEDLAFACGAEVVRLDRSELDRMSSGRPNQGVVAVTARYEYADPERLWSAPDIRLVMLDGVTDPVNLGSILRTADAFGWTGVLIPRHRSVAVTPAVRKVAAGGAERVPVARVGSPAAVVARLQKEGVTVIAVDPSGETDYRDADYANRVCIVMGAEGRGVSRLARDRCNLIVRIPMAGAMASLNVAVAAAVVMVEVTRSRGLDNG